MWQAQAHVPHPRCVPFEDLPVEEEGDSDTSNCTVLSDNDEVRVPVECSAGSDIQRVRACVGAFLEDKERIASMTPLDHLAWAEGLPPCLDTVDLPVLLEDAAVQAGKLSCAALGRHRLEAKAFWMERKRVLDPEWATRFRRLPGHVQSVLGPKKNLLLLREMLLASESPDESRVECLSVGFPLVGSPPSRIKYQECTDRVRSGPAQIICSSA